MLMLVALLTLASPSSVRELRAEIWNVSSLAAESDYDFDIEGRAKTHSLAKLTGYPRWCESTRGLVARCLAHTRENLHGYLPSDWERLTVNIGIAPGGRGAVRPLSMATISKHELNGLNIGWSEQTGQSGFLEGVEGRDLYTDPWALAEHALRMSVFGVDDIPKAKALAPEVRRTESGISFICTSDLPEPTRSVFETRMAHSTRPLIAGHPDAVYAWDWADFLNGQR